MSLKEYVKKILANHKSIYDFTENSFVAINKLFSFYFNYEQIKINLYFPLDTIQKKKKIQITELSKQNHERLHRYLKNYKGVSLTYIEKLLSAIATKWNSSYIFGITDNELIELTKTIPPSYLPPSRWLSLYDFCFTYGYLKLLILLRQKAIVSSLETEKKKTNSEFYTQLAFRAAIEKRDFPLAKKLLNKLKKIKNNSDIFRDCMKYYLIHIGYWKSNKFEKIFHLLKYRKKNESFKKLIEGKTIAIVGPAPSNEQTGNEIDSFDIVIRINYRGKDKLGDIKEFGSRTDISYYNNYDSNIIHLEKNFSYLDDLKACVFKEIKYPFQSKLQKLGRAHKMNVPHLIFNGFSLQGINIIYDVLHYCPSIIKVFKNNLFLNQNSYYKNYRSSHLDDMGRQSSKKINERFASFSAHDLVSHFEFLKNILLDKNIQADNYMKNVLKMDINSYLKNIENIYSTKKK